LKRVFDLASRGPGPCSAVSPKGRGLNSDPGPYMREQPSETPRRQPTRHAAVISPRLNAEQRRALALLAGAGMNGVTETMMLARGFTLAMLGVFVRKGLATVQWKPVRAGGKMIEVGRFRTTAAGRRAVEG
jgi:hypothetical protein